MTVKKPSPYVPSFLKAAASGSRPMQLTFSDVADTNIASTSSFIYDAPNAPLKSTQQLNVDWSRFENHTFFASAEAKTNMAFDQVINGYPFDGSRADVEVFFDKLTGFDRWVFEQFPRFKGELAFSGSEAAVGGTFIAIKDYAGALFPEISRNRTGESVLNPKGTSMSIEMQLFVPDEANDVQVVCQKRSSDTQGFSLWLTQSLSSSTVDATFSVVSGSNNISATMPLTKGRFNHLCVVLDKETSVQRILMYRQAERVSSSRTSFVIGDLDIDKTDFVIGSGSTMVLGDTTIVPVQTLSGTMDELRIFHSIRSQKQQELFAQKAIFSTPDLKLYYRFNEPPPPLVPALADNINSIVIDSSGNALHALVSNFTGTLRLNASSDPTNPVVFEKPETLTVLFPAYPNVVALNEELLMSASRYDQANPNLITRLVPQHYLLEGAAAQGFDTVEGQMGDTYGGTGIPGQGQLGNVQLMLSLLYIWARFFDEMKLYIDAFSSLRTVDYDTNISMPNNFLRDLVSQYGFHLPPLFNDATVEQYIRAENIDQEISSGEVSLKSVQNELLRRVLINLPDVLRSKGTQHSIKAFLRAVGIDPENSVRLREFGGPTTRQLSFAREHKRDVTTMVQFSSASLAVSPPLSASRVEVGFPRPAGTMVQEDVFPPHGISDDVNDGLLTSGSWTVEGIVKYTPTVLKTIPGAAQSLCRLCITGSTALSSGEGIIANLIAVNSADPSLTLYVRPGNGTGSPLLTLDFPMSPNVLFDSERWNFSFGCERNDAVDSRVSSSYFVRVAAQSNGEVSYFKTTSSYFYETSVADTNVFRGLDTVGGTNLSGTFLAVGMGQPVLSGTGAGYLYLNDTSVTPTLARTTAFTGSMSNLRFWSKALTEAEWREHVVNYRSLGVEDPLVNYNFEKHRTGSFEHVRMDSLAKQLTRRANATASLGPLGAITFLDFSLNGMHMTGTGFPTNIDCVRGEIVDYSYLSPYFDEAATNEKIRIRSYLNQDLIDATPWAGTAPVYEIVKSEQPTDDVRFAVEFSLIDALNRDIVTMFSTFDAIDNALGNPELVYSPDYPDLERLRNVYFNRISNRLNFKAFFQFFRWFDTSIGTFIQQLIPRKTNFKGTNFMIESHMLERHKLEYQSAEIYLGEEDRSRIRSVLLLQLLAGIIRKY